MWFTISSDLLLLLLSEMCTYLRFLYTMYEYFNNYAITKCLLFCDVLLMLIGSRQYTVLFPL